MMRHLSVKLLLALVFCSALPLANAQQDKPEARVLLKSARVAQANMDWKFTGHLRVGSGSAKIPFFLTVSNGLIKYDFKDNGDSIALRLGENDSRLEETVGGKTERIPPSRFGAPVRGTNISYEDLAFRFLYWTNARVVDSDIVATRDSWEIDLLPPNAGASQYAKVKVWLAKADNALMKMEAYDAGGRMVRKYVVRSFMKRDDYWFLKQMEISGGGSKKPTLLELTDVID
jgi:hypothetical protein